jgi:hypothetical protein
MRLRDVAKVIRSKNAGPLQLTLDILFPSAEPFALALRSPALTAEAVAKLYGVEPQHVRVIPFAPAHALKIVLDRPVVAGNPGDRDVYGAQQHGPLLELEL